MDDKNALVKLKNGSILHAEEMSRFTKTLEASLRYVTSNANPTLDMRDGVRRIVLGPLNVNLAFPHVNREDPRTEITGRRCTQRANSIGISTRRRKIRYKSNFNLLRIPVT